MYSDFNVRTKDIGIYFQKEVQCTSLKICKYNPSKSVYTWVTFFVKHIYFFKGPICYTFHNIHCDL